MSENYTHSTFLDSVLIYIYFVPNILGICEYFQLAQKFPFAKFFINLEIAYKPPKIDLL